MMLKNSWKIFIWNYVLFIVVIYGKSKKKAVDNLTTSNYISGLYKLQNLVNIEPISI